MNSYELAVVGKQLSSLSQQGDVHSFNIDVSITQQELKDTFFKSTAFCISENMLTRIDRIVPGPPGPFSFKHFDSAYTPSPNFSLKDCVLACSVDDIKAPFTPISLIQWTREINEIHSLSDLRIITSLRYADITTNLNDEFNVTAVFTSSNCHILPVLLRLKYKITSC